MVASAVAELYRPTPTVSGNEIWHVCLASRWCTRWSMSIWDWRLPPLATNPTISRVHGVCGDSPFADAPGRGGAALSLVVVVLECLRFGDARPGRGWVLPWLAVPLIRLQRTKRGITFPTRYRSGGMHFASPRVTRRLGGVSASRSSRLFPALLVLTAAPPVGFGDQHILHAGGTIVYINHIAIYIEMAADGTPVTYEELPAELKKKYDEIKVTLEADLIGSFQRTRSHGIDGRDSHRKVHSMG
ncbi:hypothetical protein QYE76_020542 [Lolium multiflorum]|uniref:Uncharacterized protein n=1 Tax=Lolium multiflorum TaxID=4521 RepID=A0AAD8R6G0_LOLMU|nr:hypothetical protein QYE76_020542 [Lolium multiflorum]